MAQLAMIAAVAGTLVSTAGVIQSGNAAKSAADFNARQVEAKGKAEQAVAIQQSKEEAMKRDLMLSRARAVGASSGGGIDIDLMGDIAEEGERSVQTRIWEGGEAAKGRSSQAAGMRFDGLAARKASIFKAGSTLLSGGQSFYNNFT